MELQQGIESFIGNILNDDLRFKSFTHSTSKGSTSERNLSRFFNSKLESCEDESTCNFNVFPQVFRLIVLFQNHGFVWNGCIWKVTTDPHFKLKHDFGKGTLPGTNSKTSPKIGKVERTILILRGELLASFLFVVPNQTPQSEKEKSSKNCHTFALLARTQDGWLTYLSPITHIQRTHQFDGLYLIWTSHNQQPALLMIRNMTFLSQRWAMFLFWSTCLSIRETEIIGENGEQHAVGKETSSLYHKDHVGKLLIIQVPGSFQENFPIKIPKFAYAYAIGNKQKGYKKQHTKRLTHHSSNRVLGWHDAEALGICLQKPPVAYK